MKTGSKNIMNLAFKLLWSSAVDLAATTGAPCTWFWGVATCLDHQDWYLALVVGLKTGSWSFSSTNAFLPDLSFLSGGFTHSSSPQSLGTDTAGSGKAFAVSFFVGKVSGCPSAFPGEVAATGVDGGTSESGLADCSMTCCSCSWRCRSSNSSSASSSSWSSCKRAS